MPAKSAVSPGEKYHAPVNSVVDTVEEHLKKVHEITLRKLAEDPLPTGKEAEKRIHAEIRELGLEKNIADLETDGYTILPPGKAAPIEFVERLRDKILEITEVVPESGILGVGGYKTLFHMARRDPIFEEALLAPMPLALMNYLLGYRAKVSHSSALLKGKGDEGRVMFHGDHSTKIPGPWTISLHASVSWVLNEYTRDNGAVCVVPGSHRRGHSVPDSLVMAHDHEDVKVLELPAGSVIVWHGSLWHAALPRKNEGQRLTFVWAGCRDYVQSQEAYWLSTTPEMLERNPRQFATLMGLTSQYPWFDTVDPELMATIPREMAQFD